MAAGEQAETDEQIHLVVPCQAAEAVAQLSRTIGGRARECRGQDDELGAGGSQSRYDVGVLRPGRVFRFGPGECCGSETDGKRRLDLGVVEPDEAAAEAADQHQSRQAIGEERALDVETALPGDRDRKSTRLNSS